MWGDCKLAVVNEMYDEKISIHILAVLKIELKLTKIYVVDFWQQAQRYS